MKPTRSRTTMFISVSRMILLLAWVTISISIAGCDSGVDLNEITPTPNPTETPSKTATPSPIPTNPPTVTPTEVDPNYIAPLTTEQEEALNSFPERFSDAFNDEATIDMKQKAYFPVVELDNGQYNNPEGANLLREYFEFVSLGYPPRVNDPVYISGVGVGITSPLPIYGVEFSREALKRLEESGNKLVIVSIVYPDDLAKGVLINPIKILDSNGNQTGSIHIHFWTSIILGQVGEDEAILKEFITNQEILSEMLKELNNKSRKIFTPNFIYRRNGISIPNGPNGVMIIPPEISIPDFWKQLMAQSSYGAGDIDQALLWPGIITSEMLTP